MHTNSLNQNNATWKDTAKKALTNPWVLGAGVIAVSSAVGGVVGGVVGAGASFAFSKAILRNNNQQPQTQTYIPPVMNETLNSGNCSAVVQNLTSYCTTEREALVNATSLPVPAMEAQANSSYANDVSTAQGGYSQCALEQARTLNASSATNATMGECDVQLMQALAQDAILQNPGNATQGNQARAFLEDLKREYPDHIDKQMLDFNLQYSAEDLWGDGAGGAANGTHFKTVSDNWERGNGTEYSPTFIHPDTQASMTTKFYAHFNPSNVSTGAHLVIIAPGRGEAETNYKEMAFDLNSQGIDVVVLGFEGNRNGTGRPGHVNDFYQAYVAPLDYVIEQRNNITGRTHGKVILVGHSTGGNAVIQAVERGNHTDIEKSVLISPMVKINQPETTLEATSFVQSAYEMLQGVKQFFGGSVDEGSVPSLYAPGSVRKPGEYSGNRYTSSEPRYLERDKVDLVNPPSRPTLKWIEEAAKATRFTQDLEHPKQHMYQIYTGEKDTTVSNSATYKFAQKAQCSVTEFHPSEHVLHLEKDCTRMPMVQDIVALAQTGNSSLDKLKLVSAKMKEMNPCVSRPPLRFNNQEETSLIKTGAVVGAVAAGAVAATVVASKIIFSKKEKKEESAEVGNNHELSPLAGANNE